MIDSPDQARSANDQPTRIGWCGSIAPLRPREGYVVVALALVAVICLPTAALSGGLIVGLGATPGLAAAALLVAWWLAHRRLRGSAGRAAAGAGRRLRGAHLGCLRAPPLAADPARWTAGWRGGWAEQVAVARGLPLTQAPALDAFAAQGAALGRFGQRVGWWVEGLVTGAGVPDNLVLVASGRSAGVGPGRVGRVVAGAAREAVRRPAAELRPADHSGLLGAGRDLDAPRLSSAH